MKKFFKSRGFLVSTLTLSCIGILIVCWYVSRDPTAAFQPEETPSVIQSQDWKENQGTAESHTEETENLEAYSYSYFMESDRGRLSTGRDSSAHHSSDP